MSEHHSPDRKRPRWIQWIALALISTLAIAGTALFLLVRHWPFTEARFAASLQEDFSGKVKIGQFHTVYFPRPGCIAESIVLTRSDASEGAPLFTVRRFTIIADYPDLFFRPDYISRVTLEGLHVVFPPRGKGATSGLNPGAAKSQSNTSAKKKQTRIGELVADGAILDFARRDVRDPLRFEIHQLTLASVSPDHALEYRVRLHNPEPPGEIRSTGRFGPWKSGDLGRTPMSGSYSFQNADLGTFHGIAGLLSSDGRFGGTLEQTDVQGSTDVPNFEVKRAQHPVHLTTQFHVLVNGMTGDTSLQLVVASFLRTKVVSVGTVGGSRGRNGKTTSLDMTVREGRIQDLLRLFAREERPAMSGPASLRAHVTLPPGPRRFMQRVMLDGDFAIAGGHFSNPDRQAGVDKLSQRARGEKSDPPADVASNIKGHVHLRNGTARVSGLSYEIPAASAVLNGTYNLLDEKVDLRGHLKMDAKLSDTSKGVKSFFLKVVDPLFKKKPSGSEIPVAITGTYKQPHFGIDILPKKRRLK